MNEQLSQKGMIGRPVSMTVGGKAVSADGSIGVTDPSTGLIFAEAPSAGRDGLDAAVDAAERAFESWSTTSWDERKKLLLAFCDAVIDDIDNLAQLVAIEAGKPLAKAVAEINGGVFFVRGFCDLKLKPEVLRDNENQYVRVEKRPVGVVGAITAWNYPGLLALWKIGPALLTGNTLVLKPAPSTPLATLRLGEIGRAIFPDGVLNVLSGGDDLGRWMSEHSRIGKIAFTGSVATGKAIMASAAPTLKRLTLELGGNDAAIIMPDFDLDSQAEDLFWAAFANNGQVCACMKRTYVPAELFEPLCARLSEIASKVAIGPWDQDDVQVGPLQNKKQFDRVKELAAEAVNMGGTTFFESEIPEGAGYFHPITMYRDVPQNARLVSEEQFGPILAISKYDDIDDAVAQANDSLFGLAGSVWGKDVEAAADVAVRLQAGNVFVNQHPSMGPEIPYGGIRQSGIGVECGIEGLSEYTNTVVVNIKRG